MEWWMKKKRVPEGRKIEGREEACDKIWRAKS